MSEALDLIGKRFGKLVVISRAENNHKGNTQWLCKCDCGKEKIALGYDLTHSRTISCGCRLVGTISSRRTDRTGQRYGNLTVLRMSENKCKNGGLKWICKCDCGKEIEAQGSNLVSGKAKDCGSHRGYAHNFEDLTGRKFGRLTVIKHLGTENGNHRWLCLCECGNFKETISSYLKAGSCLSCGCLLNEERHKPKRTTHKLSTSHIYREYRSMINRCSPTYHGHNRYYDKGIQVCDEWLGKNGFINFYQCVSQMEHYDEKNYSLDRIDNSKGYSPDNVRWADWYVQSNNKDSNVYIEYDGERLTLKQWSNKLNISYGAMKSRWQKGKRPPELFEALHKNQHQ